MPGVRAVSRGVRPLSLLEEPPELELPESVFEELPEELPLFAVPPDVLPPPDEVDGLDRLTCAPAETASIAKQSGKAKLRPLCRPIRHMINFICSPH